LSIAFYTRIKRHLKPGHHTVDSQARLGPPRLSLRSTRRAGWLKLGAEKEWWTRTAGVGTGSAIGCVKWPACNRSR